MDEIINPPTLDAGLKHALLEPISIALNRPIWVRLPPISSTSSPTVGVRVGTTTPSVERLGKIAEILGVSELHLAGLLQASFETEPLATQRAPKKVAEAPENMGQLTPQEKSLIARYRAGSPEQREQAEAALRPSRAN